MFPIEGEIIKFPYDHIKFVPDFDYLQKNLRSNETLKERVCINMVTPFPFSSLEKGDYYEEIFAKYWKNVTQVTYQKLNKC